MKTLICLLATSLACLASDVNLVWDANPEQVTGYHIYYGTTPNSTENKIVNVGQATQTTITGLLDNTTYYFTATAYFESDHSNQIVWNTTPPAPDKVRYYPRANYASRMVNGKIEGAEAVGGPYTVLHTITVAPPYAWTEVEVDLGNHRFLRYVAPTNSWGSIAEIEFHRAGVKLTGVLFGTPGSWNNVGNTISKAVDGNTASFWDSPQASGAFVGIDTQ